MELLEDVKLLKSGKGEKDAKSQFKLDISQHGLEKVFDEFLFQDMACPLNQPLYKGLYRILVAVVTLAA